MPLVQTRGAASAQGFGEFAQAAAVPIYIEDVFSCFLYTGNGSTQTITNGIDTSTYGGLVWLKDRSSGQSHALSDTARGVGTSKQLQSNTTGAATTDTFTGFTTSGFTLDASFGAGAQNLSAVTYASWTFREQPKFFDIVTYTGNGTNPRNISHNLGSVPGCVIVKCTSNAGPWAVYHRGISPINDNTLALQSTAAVSDGGQDLWGNGATVVVPTSTVFTVSNSLNTNGVTYVAYLFAHDAGGFGLTGTDNVISCGSFTTDGSGNATINLGYEPQWILFKSISAGQNWTLGDVMRGWNANSTTNMQIGLRANSSRAENATLNTAAQVTATGFNATANNVSDTFIYIAIRRGPMKVPTLGTSVFGMSARSGTGADATVTGGQTDDAVLVKNRGSAVASLFSSRLTGTGYLVTSDTAAEVAAGTTILQANPWDVMDGVKVGTTSTITNASANTYINWLFRRAPGFFDVVCYTGTGVATTQTHNLGAVPELMIIKRRSAIGAWATFFGMGASNYYRPLLNSSASAPLVTYSDGFGLSAQPTSTVINLDSGGAGNDSGTTYVAYLFATLAGISKVFSYTGNGSSQTINCGFTGGSRFVMIKRTDSTGDWYVWDSARGIVAGNDPHLSLNDTAAEVTTDDSVDTDNTGFVVNQLSATNVNVTSATYIGLAIA